MTALRDIMLCFAALVVTCMTGAALHLALGGAGGASGALQNSVISAVFYTPLCAFIAIAALRILKSPPVFTLMSASAAVVWAGIKAQQASASKTVQAYGHVLYIDGQVTLAGLIYELATPLSVMALGGAVYLLIKTSKFLQRYS